MPANKKYLSSPLQRFAKISAGLVGGYLITVSLHMLLMQWWDASGALITLQFGGFILWAVLLIFAFLSKNGWKIWAAYLLLSLFFLGLVYLGKTNII